MDQLYQDTVGENLRDAAGDGSISEDRHTGRPVRVRWVDSGLSTGLGWKSWSELPANVEEVETVGLWMGENDNVVMVGGTRDQANDAWLNAQLVYKPCIRTVEWLDA